MKSQRERHIDGLLDSNKLRGDIISLMGFRLPSDLLEVVVLTEGDRDLEATRIRPLDDCPIDGYKAYLVEANLQQLHGLCQQNYVGHILLKYGDKPK